MSDDELRDELVTVIGAGHETTATGLAWALERLLRTPQVLRRLQEELAADDGHAYLDAVIKEALRIRPVVLGTPRLLAEPVTIGGYDVPAGWYLSASIPLVHSDPAVFPEPEEFRPERFLGPEAARAGKAWLPFGGGRRYCVGAQLAMLEMRVVIAEVLRRVELTPAHPGPEKQVLKSVTLVPAKLARVVAVPRRASAENY
jgi:cytochrome P450